LSRVYNLDDNGDFANEVPSSAGVWIAHDEISHIMFYVPDTNQGATNDEYEKRRA
jgi:hypothetical protein